MMSLLTRFALLSSVIYFAVPGVCLPQAQKNAGHGARTAAIGLLRGGDGVPVPAELRALERAIGFNPNGFQKLSAQLRHTPLPTAADRARAVKRLTHLYAEARGLAVVVDRTSGIVGHEVRSLMAQRQLFMRAGQSLTHLNTAVQSLSESAQLIAAE